MSELIEYPLRAEGWVTPDDHAAAEQWRALVKVLQLDAAATYVGVVTQLELAVADIERLRRENTELRAALLEVEKPENRPPSSGYNHAGALWPDEREAFDAWHGSYGGE